MKAKIEKWKLQAHFVQWAAVLSPTLWTGVKLNHCWIDGRSAYEIKAELESADKSRVQLKLETGVVVPVSISMLGPEEKLRAQRVQMVSNGTPESSDTVACA